MKGETESHNTDEVNQEVDPRDKVCAGVRIYSCVADGGLNSPVRLSVQGYKSLRVAVMICATLVNTQTDGLTASDQLYC